MSLRAACSLLALPLATGCVGESDAADGRSVFGPVDLTGAGSTFIAPILTKWASDYAGQTGVRINYQPIGSGGGIRQLSEQVVDFGATDAPMKAKEEAKAKGGEVLHLPVIIGAVVAAYNLPGVDQPIRLTGDLLADMYLGEIAKWNDPRIAAINPGIALPDRDVLPVYRTDGSGTTFIFTSYLASASSRWEQAVGAGKAVRWPRSVGLGGKGNEGVAMLVKDTPGAIGYTEYAYATHNGLPMAALRNASGEFVFPTQESVSAAAEQALAAVPDTSDLKLSLINQPGAGSYPIAAFSWLLVYANPTDAKDARTLTDFVRWAVTDGAAQARGLDYTPIPPRLQALVLERLARVAPPEAAAAPAAGAPAVASTGETRP